MSTFKQIGPKRYQVLFPEDSPIVAKRLKAHSRHARGYESLHFAGTVMREDFITYKGKRRVKGSFWIARTPGYMQLKGQFKTRELAAEPLLKGVVSDPW